VKIPVLPTKWADCEISWQYGKNFLCRGVAFSDGTLYTEFHSAMVPQTAVTIASMSELLFPFSIGG
jgi:hypothetical protein